jgi:hypothetical protein
MRNISLLMSKQYVISMQGRTIEKMRYLCNPKENRCEKNLEKDPHIRFQFPSSGKTFRTRALEIAEEKHKHVLLMLTVANIWTVP